MLKGMPTSFGDFSSIQVGKRIAQGGAGTIFSLSSHVARMLSLSCLLYLSGCFDVFVFAVLVEFCLFCG